MNEILIGFSSAVAIIIFGSIGLAWFAYKHRSTHKNKR